MVGVERIEIGISVVAQGDAQFVHAERSNVDFAMALMVDGGQFRQAQMVNCIPACMCADPDAKLIFSGGDDQRAIAFVYPQSLKYVLVPLENESKVLCDDPVCIWRCKQPPSGTPSAECTADPVVPARARPPSSEICQSGVLPSWLREPVARGRISVASS
mgnify:CR=1 FL=1